MAEASAEDMIAELESKLSKAMLRIEELEEECDLLAFENDRLRTKLQTMEGSSAVAESAIVDKDRLSPTGLKNDAVIVNWDELLREGNNRFARTLKIRIENACGGSNVVCAAIVHCIDDTADIIVCGGADKTLRCFTLHNSTQISCFNLSAPPLSIDVFNQFFASSLMDGSLVIASVSRGETSHTELVSVDLIATFKDQNKYAVCVKWSPDGELLATACYDKTVALYKKHISMDGELSFVKVTILRYHVTPEAVVFVPATNVVKDSPIGAGREKYLEMSGTFLSEGEREDERGSVLNIDRNGIDEVGCYRKRDREDISGQPVSPLTMSSLRSALPLSPSTTGTDRIQMDINEGDSDNDSSAKWDLVVALRDTCSLCYVNCGQSLLSR